MAKPHRYLDVDTTDEFLDLPLPVYRPDGKPISSERIDQLLDPEYRRKHGIVLPKLPPLTDR